MNSDTKEKFKKIKVGDIGEVITGNTPPKKHDDFFGDAYPWIKPTDIDIGYRYVEEPGEYYSELAYEKYEKALLPPYTTCVVTIGTVGKKLCLTKDYSFTNQSINAIIPDEEKFDKQFVYYLMKYNLPKISKANPGTASGRHHVSKSNFCNIEVEVPPKEDQQEISSILSAFDDLIENNTRRIEILEEMARRIYREWFVHYRYPGHEDDTLVDSGTDLGEIPEEWEVDKLENIIELIYGKGLRKKDRVEGKYPVYGSSGIIDWHNDYQVEGPGVIVGRKGNVGSMFWEYENFNPIDTTFYVETPLPLTYAFFNLQNQNFINSDAAVPGLSKRQASTLPVLVPDEKILESFDTKILQLFDMKRILNKKNETLKEIRDLLLPKLISGEFKINRELSYDFKKD